MSAPFTTPARSNDSPFACWVGDHAGIRVPDLNAAVAWYGHALDFRLMESMPYGDITFAYLAPSANEEFRVELLAGPGAIERESYKDLHDSLALTGWHHLCFRVRMVDDAVAKLRRRGVTIIHEPFDVPALQGRFAFFADPWGNIFELKQRIGS
jgi:catechol 2,3-dioxygenase-like lactoylglutathione lyase family enzyme